MPGHEHPDRLDALKASVYIEHAKFNLQGAGVIHRTITASLVAAAGKYPVVTVTGPRQSGKTTLARAAFRDHVYVSLEPTDVRSFARSDPRGFLAQFDGPVVIDEAQHAPDLFSYLQVAVDERPEPGQFILTGSQNFLLLERISQSLAGRCAICHLLPFSIPELSGGQGVEPDGIGRALPRGSASPSAGLFDVMFTGFYPRIHDRGIPPTEWYEDYTRTYIERDVRSIQNVGDLETFGRFVGMCASRTAQLLNLSSLAADCGITHTTARRWLSILEASFIVALLRPHHVNFGKRLVKSPKLYLLDTGLVCHLLGIRCADELHRHHARGAVFETLVVSELMKLFHHRRLRPPLWFWRDSRGHEIDVLIETGGRLIPVEVKSSMTVIDEFFESIGYWRSLSGDRGAAALVHGGDAAFVREGTAVYPWFAL